MLIYIQININYRLFFSIFLLILQLFILNIFIIGPKNILSYHLSFETHIIGQKRFHLTIFHLKHISLTKKRKIALDTNLVVHKLFIQLIGSYITVGYNIVAWTSEMCLYGINVLPQGGILRIWVSIVSKSVGISTSWYLVVESRTMGRPVGTSVKCLKTLSKHPANYRKHRSRTFSISVCGINQCEMLDAEHRWVVNDNCWRIYRKKLAGHDANK